jgi:hypothetical protein
VDEDCALLLGLWDGFLEDLTPDSCKALLKVWFPGFDVWPSYVDPIAILSTAHFKSRLLDIPVLRDEKLDQFVVFAKAGLASLAKLIHEQRWEEPLSVDVLMVVCVLGLRLSNSSKFVIREVLVSVHDLFETASRLAVTLSNLSAPARLAAVSGNKDRLDEWARFLAHVAALCLRFFSQIMFPVFCWHRSWVESRSGELWAAPDEEDIDCMLRAARFGSSSRSALAVDMSLLGRLRDWFSAAANLPGVAALRIVLVETVALLGYGGSVPPQLLQALRMQGLLLHVVETLGWSVQEGDNDKMVSLHFSLQLTGFRAIGSLGESSHENAMHLMQQLDFVSRAIDAVLWFCEKEQARRSGAKDEEAIFIEHAAEPLEVFREIAEAKALIGPPYVMPVPQEPRKGLLSAKLRLLFSAYSAFVFGCPHSMLNSMPAQVKTMVEARSRVFASLLDLFDMESAALSANQVRARASSLMAGLQLQAHVLAVFTEALSKPAELASVVTQALRQRNVWDVLFSECFFRQGDAALPSNSKEVQELVWGLLEHVGSADPKNNKSEVACCLSMLSRFPIRASAVLECFFTCNAAATSLFDGQKVKRFFLEFFFFPF